jgi:phospholipid/cholesterol/gamma-HCH transport system substrate-binding protein
VTDKADRFVSDDTNKIIGVNIASRDALQLAAAYSPELPCVFQALTKFKPKVESAIGGRNPMLNLTIEMVKPRPAYKPGIDDVRPADQRGPRCYGLPDPQAPFSDYVVLDGTQNDVWWNTSGSSGTTTTADPLLGNPAATGRGMAISSILLQPGTGVTDKDMIKNVLAPLMRIPAAQVPDGAQLLYGPLVHGGVVTLR